MKRSAAKLFRQSVPRDVFARDFGPDFDRHLFQHFAAPAARIENRIDDVGNVFHAFLSPESKREYSRGAIAFILGAKTLRRAPEKNRFSRATRFYFAKMARDATYPQLFPKVIPIYGKHCG